MKTLAQREIELRYQCGRQAPYCTGCLRVAIGDGVEFWQVMPD